jgi:cyanate lyase
MGEDKEMSKKIEILEDELAEKENTITDLRKNKTMTREEIEEELGKITRGQTAMLIKQNEKIEFLTDAVMRALNLQEKK